MRGATDVRNSSRQGLCAVGAILLVAAVGISLAFQGWNSRLMNFDHVNFTDAAARLLSDGILPDRGDVSSYWAFATPGPAWLMVPGMLVFEDPRLYEAVGSAGLYIGTLWGLFLLARMCFGLRCAYLSVLVYGLSRDGLFIAGSLWSIGHPFFYVWMAYFCLLWVQRNNPKYLAAAIVAWSAGMYVDMVLAPAMFVFPAVWLLYRPRVRVTPLLAGALITAAIWFPYLRFESTRNFADLKALVMRQEMRPMNYKASWCVPSRVIQSLNEPGGDTGDEMRLASLQITERSNQPSVRRAWYESLTQQIRRRYQPLKDALSFNFDQMTWTPLSAAPLLLLAMITLAFSALRGSAPFIVATNNWAWLRWIPRFAWVLLCLAVLVNERSAATFLSATGSLERSTVWEIRTLQAGLLLTASAVLLLKGQLSARLRRFIVQHSERGDDVPYSSSAVVAVALVVPWLALAMVVEADNYSRYFWLWPLQMVLIVAAVTYVPERLGSPRSVAWFGQACVTLILLTHPWVVSPVQAWVSSGWSGPRADDVQAADYIASQVRSQGRNTVAIGYQTLIASFMAKMNIVDPRYKVGAELDLYFKHRYGLSNSTQCAEGVSSGDEYRIVQLAPKQAKAEAIPISWAPLGSEVKTHNVVEYFNIALDPSFRMMRQFGDFQVFQRSVTPLNERGVRSSGSI